ncbi:MAG: hypothetical protein M5U26_15860 [Planctomycetota bacterium]|nr:hypothetical protein [Planctomycetota bacterium]
MQASERLDKDDPLGLSILKEGAVSAIYRKDGKEAKVFLAQVEETFLRASVLKRFHDLMAKEGKVEELPLGDQGHAGKLKGQRFLVAQRESVVYGVLGNLDDNQLQELMAIVDRKIKPFVPAQYKDLQKAKEKEEEKRNSFTGNAPGE